MLPITKILLPTDFSEQSEAAFRFAAALARDYGARLVLLHVSQVPVLAYAEGVAVPLPDDTKDVLLERLQALPAKVAPTVPVETHLEEGDPGTEILRMAKDKQVDLIVMGTHGLTGLTRMLMGSVAEQVSRKAACPVLTLKTPFPEAAPAPVAAMEAAGV